MHKSLMLLGFLAVTLLAGCSLKTSGVNTLGGNTFSVSSDGPNDSETKGSALSQAREHCAAKGQKVLVTKLRKRHNKMRYYYDVTFKCLPENDPQLQNPEYERTETTE